jgi:hypothetical protein
VNLCLLNFLIIVISVVVWLSPTFLTILIAGFWLQSFFVSKANQSNFIDVLLRQLEELKVDSLEYWNLDFNLAGNPERGKILAQKMKGAIKSLNSDIAFYNEKYKKEAKLSGHLNEIFETCTSGDFEGVSKPIDSGRYVLIVNAINKLKSQLLRGKL